MVLILSACATEERTKVTAKTEVLPEIILSVPEKPEHQEYLGLIQDETFRLPQVEAQVLIVEIFSMYCPYCQREAPIVNELYRKIENSRKLRGRVKLIGIGVGNSSFEIEVFQKQYNISFPLFSDADFTIQKKLDEVAIPYFICLRIDKNRTPRVFYKRVDGFEDADQFLEFILDRSELK